ncbi:MAG: sigma-70 family RNA polymerase sigma factor [Planctomycetes bacterium]|nr:sigma-70 family RNA polymerase sigma factor [Planctomycetota bacterium]
MTREAEPRSEGERGPTPALDTAIYRELHQLAARQLADQRGNHTLQPTALVHEAYLRIARLDGADGRGRGQFFALAGKAMRSVLVDHARRRHAAKRQGGERIDLTTGIGELGRESIDVLDLDDALGRLALVDPELVTIVELLFFAGMTASEAGEALGVSGRTVERGWRTARAWLRSALAGS